MVDGFLKNTFAILFGNIFFRVGGYIYKFLMVYLLSSFNYGVLTVISPFQNILQIFASGGLPPTISKYISEYNAINQEKESYKIILVSLKIALILGVFFSLLMVLFIAPFIAKIYNNPALLMPLQIVGLIVPFSAIVGSFRGIFQGNYKMEYILFTRSAEQIVMIITATILVILGFSVVGAIFGSVIAFIASLVSAIYIFNRYFSNIVKNLFKLNMTFKEEIKIAYKIISFSIPVILTAISEIGIYSISTTIMPLFISISEIGYFGIAEPIARLPLILSNSLATTMLPVSSEMFAVKNNQMLREYVFNSFRYNLLIMIPTCLFIMIFSKELLLIMFFTKPIYSNASLVLTILILGMFFYSIFSISSSIIQGIGKPKVTMYLLVFGFVQLLILSFILIPYFGVNGGAIATTLTTATITAISLIYLNKLISINFNRIKYLKCLFAGLPLVLFLWILPSNSLGFLLGLIFLFPVYLISLMMLKGFISNDLKIIYKFKNKMPFLNKLINLFTTIY